MTTRYRTTLYILAACLTAACREGSRPKETLSKMPSNHRTPIETSRPSQIAKTSSHLAFFSTNKKPVDTADFHAGFDENCTAMDAKPAPMPQISNGKQPYFLEPVPRHLHQIWYGRPWPDFERRMAAWEKYAELFGYTYTRWGDQDDDHVKTFLPEENFSLLQEHRLNHDFKAASDVLRLSLLETFGGYYLDSDLHPPFDSGGYFDLSAWIAPYNVAAIAEAGSRETDSVGAFLTNCFLMASPSHPLISHMVATLPQNHRAWQRHFLPVAEYVSGPFFFTKSWAGPLTVINIREAGSFGLFGPSGPPIEKVR